MPPGPDDLGYTGHLNAFRRLCMISLRLANGSINYDTCNLEDGVLRILAAAEDLLIL
jgi:hypothetical protein